MPKPRASEPARQPGAKSAGKRNVSQPTPAAATAAAAAAASTTKFYDGPTKTTAKGVKVQPKTGVHGHDKKVIEVTIPQPPQRKTRKTSKTRNPIVALVTLLPLIVLASLFSTVLCPPPATEPNSFSKYALRSLGLGKKDDGSSLHQTLCYPANQYYTHVLEPYVYPAIEDVRTKVQTHPVYKQHIEPNYVITKDAATRAWNGPVKPVVDRVSRGANKLYRQYIAPHVPYVKAKFIEATAPLKLHAEKQYHTHLAHHVKAGKSHACTGFKNLKGHYQTASQHPFTKQARKHACNAYGVGKQYSSKAYTFSKPHAEYAYHQGRHHFHSTVLPRACQGVRTFFEMLANAFRIARAHATIFYNEHLAEHVGPHVQKFEAAVSPYCKVFSEKVYTPYVAPVIAAIAPHAAKAPQTFWQKISDTSRGATYQDQKLKAQAARDATKQREQVANAAKQAKASVESVTQRAKKSAESAATKVQQDVRKATGKVKKDAQSAASVAESYASDASKNVKATASSVEREARRATDQAKKNASSASKNVKASVVSAEAEARRATDQAKKDAAAAAENIKASVVSAGGEARRATDKAKKDAAAAADNVKASVSSISKEAEKTASTASRNLKASASSVSVEAEKATAHVKKEAASASIRAAASASSASLNAKASASSASIRAAVSGASVAADVEGATANIKKGAAAATEQAKASAASAHQNVKNAAKKVAEGAAVIAEEARASVASAGNAAAKGTAKAKASVASAGNAAAAGTEKAKASVASAGGAAAESAHSATQQVKKGAAAKSQSLADSAASAKAAAEATENKIRAAASESAQSAASSISSKTETEYAAKATVVEAEPVVVQKVLVDEEKPAENGHAQVGEHLAALKKRIDQTGRTTYGKVQSELVRAYQKFIDEDIPERQTIGIQSLDREITRMFNGLDRLYSNSKTLTREQVAESVRMSDAKVSKVLQTVRHGVASHQERISDPAKGAIENAKRELERLEDEVESLGKRMSADASTSNREWAAHKALKRDVEAWKAKIETSEASKKLKEVQQKAKVAIAEVQTEFDEMFGGWREHRDRIRQVALDRIAARETVAKEKANTVKIE